MSIFIVFMDPVVKPRGDHSGFYWFTQASLLRE
ncbi:MAG: palindromic element RPE4 domain-containing protein [Rickettsia slovaca]